jgi:hypothetical protein
MPGVMGVAPAGVPRDITVPAKKHVRVIFAEFIYFRFSLPNSKSRFAVNTILTGAWKY